MDLNDFNELCKVGPAMDSARQRQHHFAVSPLRYMSYERIRGQEAREISVAMNIDEESGISHTGYLVELRYAEDHTRISAHASTYAREVLVYSDQSVITIDLDKVKEEAVQTVYSPNGNIELLSTGWSYRQNGYHGPYRQISLSEGMNAECMKKWRHYENLVYKAETLITSKNTPNLDR